MLCALPHAVTHIVEVIINFCINIYQSTFFCFLEFVARGGLELLLAAVQDVHLTHTKEREFKH